MLLSTQIQAMLYAFIAGIAYGILFSMKQYFCMYLLTPLKKSIVDVLFHIIFISLVFLGLYRINKGESNLYLYILFFIGIYLYYILYYDMFCVFFRFLLRKFKPIYYSIYLLYSKFYSIMLKERRKKRHGKKEKRKKKIKSTH